MHETDMQIIDKTINNFVIDLILMISRKLSMNENTVTTSCE